MKKLSVRCSVFLLVLLSMLLLVGCTGLIEVTSTDEPEIIVFQTGSTWLTITLQVFNALLGLSGLLLGIVIVWAAAKDFVKKSKKLKGLWVFFFGLLFVSGGILMILGASFWWSYSENIIVDTSRQIISVEKHSLLKGEEGLQISFDDIAYITYNYTPGSYTGQYSNRPPIGRVEITKHDGTKVNISEGKAEKSQRDLARVIAQATGKSLEEK